MANTLTDLQTLVAARLNALDLFADNGITALTEDVGDLTDEVTEAVNEIGLSVALVTPLIQPNGDGFGLVVDFVVNVSEMVTLNRGATGTGQPALDVAVAIWNSLDEWQPAEIWSPFNARAIQLAQLDPELVYNVTLRTEMILAED